MKNLTKMILLVSLFFCDKEVNSATKTSGKKVGYQFPAEKSKFVTGFTLDRLNKFTKSSVDNFFAKVVANTYGLDFDTVRPIVSKIIETSQLKRLDPLWALAIVMTESSFNPGAVSSKDALGLMQVKLGTAKQVHATNKLTRNHLFDPNFNIETGIQYLRYLSSEFKGNAHLATAAYNLGPYKLIDRIRAKEIDYPTNYLLKVSKNYQQLFKSFAEVERPMLANN